MRSMKRRIEILETTINVKQGLPENFLIRGVDPENPEKPITKISGTSDISGAPREWHIQPEETEEAFSQRAFSECRESFGCAGPIILFGL